jgi:hypothetical protein
VHTEPLLTLSSYFCSNKSFSTLPDGKIQVVPGKAEVYDTFSSAKESIRLPAPDDADFKATVITFSPPDFKDIAGNHA